MKLSFTAFVIFVTISILFTINNLLADNIKIIEQPKSVTECKGKQVTLSVDALSDENLKLYYQWYKDNTLIPKAVNSLLSFETISFENSGTYFCRITSEDIASSINSNPAALYVLSQTSITKQPVDIKYGNYFDKSFVTLSFNAHINGFSIEEAKASNEYVDINWFLINDNGNSLLKDDETYNGTKSNNLSIKLSNIKDTSYYFAVIEGQCGIDTTRIVSVIKNLKDLIISVQIEDLDACEGNIYSLKAETKTNFKNVKIDYRWYKDGKPLYNKPNLKGVYTNELIFNPILKEDAGKYRLEAQIKDSNIISLSNIVNVKVIQKPEIICIRIDSKNYWLKREYFQLSVFFKETSDSNYIDIYKDGEILFTFPPYLASWYHYNFNKINIASHAILRSEKESKYWAVIRNECGEMVSDTVSIENDLNDFNKCDPWHQYNFLCEGDSLVLELDLSKNYGSYPIYKWNSNISMEFWNSGDIIQDKNKLIFKNLKREHSGRYQLMIDYLDTTHFTDFFNILVKAPPKITAKPKDSTFISGNTETIFIIGIKYYLGDSTYSSLYFMPYKGAKPILLEESLMDITGDYKYRKQVSKADEGYYYAVLSNGYCGTSITDTVRVTVVPSGSITNINNKLTENKYFSIYPNPSNDYIEIKPSEGWQPSEGYKVQIFNTLGINVSPAGGGVNGVDGGGFRIDISHLPAGVYFIKIGNKVEKFVKM